MTNQPDAKTDERNQHINEVLDWIGITSLTVLILSLFAILLLNKAPNFSKTIDVTIIVVSLIVTLFTIPLPGRESRIGKVLSFLKRKQSFKRSRSSLKRILIQIPINQQQA